MTVATEHIADTNALVLLGDAHLTTAMTKSADTTVIRFVEVRLIVREDEVAWKFALRNRRKHFNTATGVHIRMVVASCAW